LLAGAQLVALCLPLEGADSAPGAAPPVVAPTSATATPTEAAALAAGSALTNGLRSLTPGMDAQTLAAMMAGLDDRQKLGAGDRVIYRVVEDQDEPKSLTVTDTGDLDVPYYGLVTAANKTCRQLAQEIKGLLEKQLYYRATVIIGLELINKKRTLGKVYVVGQVRLNGPQEIPDDEVFTVSKAILKAGGFSDFADKKKVRLIRASAGTEADKKTFFVNVSDIWEKGKTENDLKLEPDDLIYVPARLVNF
jgi:protein involved in polysaccharide export with SLBB domain